MLQRTIQKSVSATGIGLHSGSDVTLVLRPAAEDSGIIFSVEGESGKRFFDLKPEAVTSTGLATTICNGSARLSTVEHLLAAARGLEIDNLLVEVEGGEVPIMDGSAAAFVELFRQAGVRCQARHRTALALKKPVTFEKDGKYIKARPAEGMRVDFTIDFKHPLIGRQRLAYEQSPAAFIRLLSKARTFGFLKDVEMLRTCGLARGGSLDNAVVLDDKAVVNPEGLRYRDEFVRHKVLDFIGDMALLGEPLLGEFKVYASGHELNNAFLRFLSEHRDEYLEPVVLREREDERFQCRPNGVDSGTTIPVVA